MTTWTCKGLFAGAICLVLAGCDDLGGLQPGQPEASAEDALKVATLARGAVTIVPPAGFCVDKRSLRTAFALMARCDILGGVSEFGTPVALITAAIVPQSAYDTSGSDSSGEKILKRRQYENVTIFQVEGTPPSAEMRTVFWRAVADVGDHVIGLAIYEASDGAELGERAPDLLSQTLRQTRSRTQALAQDAQDNSATTQAKPATN